MSAERAVAPEEEGDRRALQPAPLARSRPRALVVDDEPEMRRTLSRVLGARGIDVTVAADGVTALEILSRKRIDVVLADLMMPNLGGLELLHRMRAEAKGVEIIMMTAHHDVDTAVQAMRSGAFHFITKPFRSNEEVVLSVLKASQHRQLADSLARLEREREERDQLGKLIGNSRAMRDVYRLALGVAPTCSTVLIQGESGTGKELTARAIHQNSPRAARVFIALNCSAIPESLFESELFGHERGAFTGATQTREGLFEAASGGTIFLDEVGDLPKQVQVKLLRALQEGEIKRVGSNDIRRVDVRVIAATNVPLRECVERGTFREDLFYRLNVVEIRLPALRERQEDVPLLAHHFLEKYATRAQRAITAIAPETMAILERARWLGNVRELENAIERAVVFCRGNALLPEHLPAGLVVASPSASMPPTGAGVSLPPSLLGMDYADAKRQAIVMFDHAFFEDVLRKTGGNVSQAARLSGLDRSNFRRAARRSGVDPQAMRDEDADA